MRTHATTAGLLAVLAGLTTVTTGTAAADAADRDGSAAHAAATTTRERGIVLECSGTVGRRPVYASLYENSAHGNVLQVLIGRDGHRMGGSRPDADGFLHRGRVRAAMPVGGSRALVAGTARTVGEPVPVSEEQDDAGQHVTATGTHRSLGTALTLTWRGRTAPLECPTAFRYDLRVTRESTTG